MRRILTKTRCVCLTAVIAIGCQVLWAQSALPRLVPFSGSVVDAGSHPASGRIALTFTFYEEQQGGAPLWSETQTVSLDGQGHYSALLGSAHADGLPQELFTGNQARWVGVQPALPGVAEQPRVMLVGVPYAMKASDAETLGGKPAAAYVTTDLLNAAVQQPAVVTGVSSGAESHPEATTPATMGNGKKGFIPIWTSSTAQADSVLFQSGTGTGAHLGIGTATPASTLDVNGGANVRGDLILPATRPATATSGSNSNPLDLEASSFNSANGLAINQDFRWQAEAAGNDSTSPSGTLNLLFGTGAVAPAETGLSISSSGTITFAAGQTFPSVAGNETVTGTLTANQLTSTVATGTPPLAVTSTTQVPNLNASLLGGLPQNAFAQTGAPNVFSTNQIVNGNVTATQFGSTIGTGQPPFFVQSSTQVANLNASLLGGQPATAFAQLTGANVFTGNVSATQFVSTAPPGQVPFVVNSATQVANLNATLLGGLPSGNYVQINNLGQVNVNGTINSSGTISAPVFELPSDASGTLISLGVAPFIHTQGGTTNIFAGLGAGGDHTNMGPFNSALGYNALKNSSMGQDQTAIGAAALQNNTGGNGTTAVGFAAGSGDIQGSNNTYIGSSTGASVANLSYATAIGANAVVAQSNSLILGNTGVHVGIGTSAPPEPLTIQADDNGSARGVPAQLQIQGSNDTRQQLLLGYLSAAGVKGAGYGTIQATEDNISNTPLMLNPLGGGVTVGTMAVVSPTLTVGQGQGNPIADGWSTYSSRRWKTNIRTLPDALDKVEHLRGVSYDLKSNGKHEIGVIAEEVGAVVPEVVNWEQNGTDAQGVDYSRLTALLIEAVKQQQIQIARDAAAIRSLRVELRETRQTLQSALRH